MIYVPKIAQCKCTSFSGKQGQYEPKMFPLIVTLKRKVRTVQSKDTKVRL